MYTRMLLLGLTLVSATLCAWAQMGSPQTPPDPQPTLGELMRFANTLKDNMQTVVKSTPQGLFVLRNGILAKYDATTLAYIDQVSLYGDLPAAPDANASPEQMLPYEMEQGKRILPATMVQAGHNLVIAQGEKVFCYDAVTLKPRGTTDVPLDLPMRDRLAALMVAPSIDVAGNLLYLARGTQLTVVDLTNGHKTDMALPDTMTPDPVGLFADRANRNGGKNTKKPGEPRTITMVGVVHHVELEGGFWVVDGPDGRFVLQDGEQTKRLLATPKIDGASIKMTGVVTSTMGVAQYGDGYLTLTQYEIIPR